MKKNTLLLALSLSAGAPGIARAQIVDPGMPAPNPTPAPMASPSTGRPEAKTVGIGFGVTFPGDLTTPNTASVRFAMSPDLILEPMLNISYRQTSVDPGFGNTTSTSTTTLGVGTTARFRLASNGPVDLAGLGSFSFQHVSNDLMVDTNQQTLNLNWGLGVTWYFSQWWSLSLDGVNPLFSLIHMGTTLPGNDSSNTSWTFGAIFNPTVLLMVHLYM